MQQTFTLPYADYADYQETYIDNENCPVARALRRAFPEQSIWVGGFFVTIGDVRYNLIGGKMSDLRKAASQHADFTFTIEPVA